MPIFNGALGIVLGTLAGLSVSGSFVLGAITASASYIDAPAAVRAALPQANPSIYLTSSLGITFPFNSADRPAGVLPACFVAARPAALARQQPGRP
jgi:hypothetical protein